MLCAGLRRFTGVGRRGVQNLWRTLALVAWHAPMVWPWGVIEIYHISVDLPIATRAADSAAASDFNRLPIRSSMICNATLVTGASHTVTLRLYVGPAPRC
jgi:hypothetical protein